MKSSNLKWKSISVLKWSAADMVQQISKLQRQGRGAEAQKLERWRRMTLEEIERREKSNPAVAEKAPA